MAAMPTVGVGQFAAARLLVTVEVASFVVGPGRGGLAWAGSLPATVAWWEPGSALYAACPCAAYASPLW